MYLDQNHHQRLQFEIHSRLCVFLAVFVTTAIARDFRYKTLARGASAGIYLCSLYVILYTWPVLFRLI